VATLLLEPGKQNVFDKPFVRPDSFFEWGQTTFEFYILDKTASPPATLLHKSSHVPPGGIEMVNEHEALITLEPADLGSLPQDPAHLHWELVFAPGEFNRFIVEEGPVAFADSTAKTSTAATTMP